MRISPGTIVNQHVVFISSGDDLLAMRDRLDRLFTDVVNSVLYHRKSGTSFLVDRWENTAPGRATAVRINRDFVDRALKSSLTVVMIRDRLGAGTEEELLAVLDDLEGPEVAILWFPPTRKANKRELRRIEKVLNPYRDQVLWSSSRVLGDPDSEETWIEVVRLILTFVLETLQPTHRPEAPVELR